MKRQILFFSIGILLSGVIIVHFASCNAREYDEVNIEQASLAQELQAYAKVHNAGLEYIKSDAESTSQSYTTNRLDSVFEAWVAKQYGRNEANEILQQISPITTELLNGSQPSLGQTRSVRVRNSTHEINPLVQQALDDCMRQISRELSNTPDAKIFDNQTLLKKLHHIITLTCTNYSNSAKSPLEIQALKETLGVLYGSIEYWTNSHNAKFWSTMRIEQKQPSKTLINTGRFTKEHKKDEPNKNKKIELTKEEWIAVVAEADAAGAAIGMGFGGVGGGALAAAASAAAALYYDVKAN